MNLHEQIDPYMLDNVEETDQRLGNGSYGEVKVVKHGGKEYAGKYFYPCLQSQQMKDSIKKECYRAFSIEHENIVKAVGLFYVGCERMVLVMELMSYSLSSLLNNDQDNLPESIKLQILHGVSKGLEFLHSKHIIHRDLTANNVLLTKTLKAKISDFGQAKCVQGNVPISARQTPLPGTEIYMPPEAIGIQHDPSARQLDLAEYSFPLDIFSFGVLILHIYLQRWPSYESRFCKCGDGLFQHIRPVEYFSKDIQSAMAESHPLHPVLIRCLDERPGERPAPTELVKDLHLLLSNTNKVFVDLMKMLNESEEKISFLQTTKCKIEEELDRLREKLEQQNEELKLQGQENDLLREEWRRVAEMCKSFKQKRTSLPSISLRDYVVVGGKSLEEQPLLDQNKENIIESVYNESYTDSINRERKEKDILWEENQKLIERVNQLERENEQLRQRVHQERHPSMEESSLFQSMRHYVEPTDPPTVMCLQGEVREFIDDGKRLQATGIRRSSMEYKHVEGAKAVVLQGKVYMGRATTKVQSYDRVLQKWDTLPEAPVKNYCMVDYQGQLVLAGGSNEVSLVSDLYVYHEEERRWSNNDIPPMQIPREKATAASFGKYIVILGGSVHGKKWGFGSSKSVEVYDGVTRQWYNGPDLLRAGCVMQSACADGFLYLLNPDGWTIRYCSLNLLVDTAVRSGSGEGIWQTVGRSVPYARCSLTVYNQTLITLAGAGSDGHVYAYNPKNKKWEKIECSVSLPAIKNACCLQVGQKELILCGGDIDMMNQTARTGYYLCVEEPPQDNPDGNNEDELVPSDGELV